MNDARCEYLIRKRGAYYRPNSQGYTTSAIQAGRYTLDEAQDISHPNGPNGPRDGMDYIHESEIRCEDWRDYTALRARLEAVERQRDRAHEWTGQLHSDVAIYAARAERAEAALATARRDALDEAAKVAYSWVVAFSTSITDFNIGGRSTPTEIEEGLRVSRSIYTSIRALANEAET